MRGASNPERFLVWAAARGYMDAVTSVSGSTCNYDISVDCALVQSGFNGRSQIAAYLVDEKGAVDVDKAMIAACIGGHREFVESMILRGAVDFDHALVTASKHGHVHIVDDMVAMGATEFEKAFRYACMNGHADVVSHLVHSGKLGIRTLSRGFVRACSLNQIHIVRYFVNHFPQVMETCNSSYFYQGLLNSAEFAFFDIVELLMNTKRPSFEDVIEEATNDGRVGAIDNLLALFGKKRDESIYTEDEEGVPSTTIPSSVRLTSAMTTGDVETVAELFRNDVDNTMFSDLDLVDALHTAVHSRNFDMVKTIVELSGVDLNAYPIHKAIPCADCEIIAYLLLNGNAFGLDIAIHLAALNGLHDVMRVLMDAGGIPRLGDVWAAAKGGHEKMVFDLLDHHTESVSIRSDLDDQDRTRRRVGTAIFRSACQAASSGHGTLARKLLERLEHIEPKERDQLATCAIKGGCIRLLNVLLRDGAFNGDGDRFSRGYRFASIFPPSQPATLDWMVSTLDDALYAASFHGHLPIANLLLKRGATDVSCAALAAAGNVKKPSVLNFFVSRHGASNLSDALVHAANFGNLPVTKFLLEKTSFDGRVWDALKISSYRGQLETVKYLLERRPGDVTDIEFLIGIAERSKRPVVRRALIAHKERMEEEVIEL